MYRDVIANSSSIRQRLRLRQLFHHRYMLLTGAMAPTSPAKGWAATSEEARPCWEGAKAVAEAIREVMIIDFMLGYYIYIFICTILLKLWVSQSWSDEKGAIRVRIHNAIKRYSNSREQKEMHVSSLFSVVAIFPCSTFKSTTRHGCLDSLVTCIP